MPDIVILVAPWTGYRERCPQSSSVGAQETRTPAVSWQRPALFEARGKAAIWGYTGLANVEKEFRAFSGVGRGKGAW